MFNASQPIEPKPKLIPMRDLKPCQLAYIRDCRVAGNKNHIVMRTSDTDQYCVMDLTAAGPDGQWSCENDIMVEPFKPGESVTLTAVE